MTAQPVRAGGFRGDVDVDDEPDGVRVRAHPGLCRGCGECHRSAPEIYPLDEHGEIAIHLLSVPASHALDAWRGATACPERSITIIGKPEAYWLERQRAETRVELHGTTDD